MAVLPIWNVWSTLVQFHTSISGGEFDQCSIDILDTLKSKLGMVVASI